MNEKKRLMSIFGCLCYDLNLNNFNENANYNLKSLKMDFNSIYGGYRIDTIKGDGSTGEDFFIFSSRFKLKEMISMIQGILHGIKCARIQTGTATDIKLGELLSSTDETIRRNATSILKRLQK